MPEGSVYLCEDIHGLSNRFAAYAAGLVTDLNAEKPISGRVMRSEPSAFQQAVHSIHFYPYVCVIEKHRKPPSEFVAPRHGTEWQPFLK